MPDSIEKKIATAAEFISNFQNESVSIEDLVITDDIYIKRVNYKAEKLFLKDVHFKGQLFFDNCDLKDGIKFINCEFENYLVFHSCLSKKKNYDFLPGDKSIEFVNCKISFQIDIRNSKFEGGVIFNNCVLEKASFEQLIVSEGGGLELRNNTVLYQSIWVSNCSFLKDGIRLTESIFKGHLRFENNAIGSYNLSFSNFAKNIYIWAGYCNSISFYQSQFEDDFNLQAVKVKDELSIIENVFKKSFRIQLDEENGSKRGNLSHVYLSQSDFLNDFSLKQFNSKKTAINKINLSFKNLNGSFHFNDVLIDQLCIDGFNKDSRLVLNNVILNELWLENFRNSGSIDFINVRPDKARSKIKLINSILGPFAFINCKLDTYQLFEIHDSIFDQVISSGTKWFNFSQIATISRPRIRSRLMLIRLYIKTFNRKIHINKIIEPLRKIKKVNLQTFKNISVHSRLIVNINMLFINLPHDNSDVQKLYQIREIFRQLKVSMDKQGNRIQGLFFQSQEFIAYEKELRLTHRIWKPERLILWSNRSNSHGQDWLKPLFLGILFTGLWFIFMVISMNPNLGIHLPWNCNFLTTYKIYAEYFKGAPDLFNPTFRLDFVFPAHTNEFTFATYLWALIQRISISYFIFQTISAFRKYMK